MNPFLNSFKSSNVKISSSTPKSNNNPSSFRFNSEFKDTPIKPIDVKDLFEIDEEKVEEKHPLKKLRIKYNETIFFNPVRNLEENLGNSKGNTDLNSDNNTNTPNKDLTSIINKMINSTINKNRPSDNPSIKVNLNINNNFFNSNYNYILNTTEGNSKEYENTTNSNSNNSNMNEGFLSKKIKLILFIFNKFNFFSLLIFRKSLQREFK